MVINPLDYRSRGLYTQGMASIKLTNVMHASDADPVREALQGKTYMNFNVTVCPVGGSCDVNLETLDDDVSEAELTDMALEVLCGVVLQDPVELITTIRLSPAQERVLGLIAFGQPLTSSDGRTVPVLHRRGLITPREPRGTGWHLTALGLKRTQMTLGSGGA